jgi:3-oxo-5-alpha-steroid 4-dehydrogenase 1
VIEADLYAHLLTGVFIAAGLSAAMLLLLTAPYGRHARGGWGPTMDTRWSWVVMESPSALWFLAVFFAGAHAWSLAPLALAAMWQAHYIQRAFIFPFTLRPGGRTPITVTVMGFFFNLVNAYLNARWLSHFGEYDTSWLWSPAFLIGLTLFITGYRINRWADRVLANLRKPPARPATRSRAAASTRSSPARITSASCSSGPASRSPPARSPAGRSPPSPPPT